MRTGLILYPQCPAKSKLICQICICDINWKTHRYLYMCTSHAAAVVFSKRTPLISFFVHGQKLSQCWWHLKSDSRRPSWETWGIELFTQDVTDTTALNEHAAIQWQKGGRHSCHFQSMHKSDIEEIKPFTDSTAPICSHVWLLLYNKACIRKGFLCCIQIRLYLINTTFGLPGNWKSIWLVHVHALFDY